LPSPITITEGYDSMSEKCASRWPCHQSVEAASWWCDKCQQQALSSQGIGDQTAVARVPNLNPSYQPRLATHPQALVRLVVLERTDLTDAVRAALTKDPDEHVRIAAAALRETPGQDLFRLIYQDNPDLLWVLAGNATLHPRGLQLLCEHPAPAIAERAKKTLLYRASQVDSGARRTA
jgi:hypothetical protein